MSASNATVIQSKKGALPHIEWLDIKGNGVFHECCVVKRDDFGNISFFSVNSLDRIDKNRLVRILSSRLAPQMACWDLLSQSTLNNGVNALEYFHYLVKTVTPTGQVYSPREGIVGTNQVTGKMDTRSEEDRVAAAKLAEEKQAQLDASIALKNR